MVVRDRDTGFEAVVALLMAVAVVVLVVGRMLSTGEAELTIWGDRALWRGLDIHTSGGGFHPPLATILSALPTVQAVAAASILMFAAALLLLGGYIARAESTLAGLLVAVAFAGSGLTHQMLGVGNPGFIPLFATIATVAGCHYLRGGGALALGVTAITVAFGMRIHSQIAQVAIGLLLAAPFYRPSFTRRHLAALLIGLALPYLPTILANGPGWLWTAISSPGDAVTNYVVWDLPRRKAWLLYDLFGGGADAFGMIIGDSRYHRATWLLMTADAVAAILTLAFMTGLLRRRAHGHSRGLNHDRDDEGAPAGAFVAIVLVTMATAVISDVDARHFLAAMPAVAAVVGLAAERVIRRHGRGGIAAAMAVVVALVLAARPLILGAAAFVEPPIRLDGVSGQPEIVATDAGPMLVAPRTDHRGPIGVLIRRDGSGYAAELHGRPPRGDTALCLAGDNGAALASFGDAARKSALTPWRSARFELPEGTYRAWLVGTDARQPGDVGVALGGLTLPGLEANTAEDQPPPDGCLAGADRKVGPEGGE